MCRNVTPTMYLLAVPMVCGSSSCFNISNSFTLFAPAFLTLRIYTGSATLRSSTMRAQPRRALGTLGFQLLTALKRRFEMRKLRCISSYFVPISSIQPYTYFLWAGQDTSSLRCDLSNYPVRGDLYRRRKREQKCESITGEAASVFGYRPVCRD